MPCNQYAIALVSGYEALSVDKQIQLFDNLIETSFDTIRRSIDGTKFVCKWRNETCPLEDVGLEHNDYDLEGILVEMAKPAWAEVEL